MSDEDSDYASAGTWRLHEEIESLVKERNQWREVARALASAVSEDEVDAAEAAFVALEKEGNAKLD